MIPQPPDIKPIRAPSLEEMVRLRLKFGGVPTHADYEDALRDAVDDIAQQVEARMAPLQRRFRRLLVLGLLGFAAFFALGFAWGLQARAEPVAGPIRVIDGDTVELLRSGEIIRLYNIDAPEARPCAGGTHGGAPSSCARCPAELALAARAGARLAAMLEGQPVAIHRCEPSGRCKDRYGRTLARLEAAGRDVGEALINEGLATRWPERGNWCGRE